MVKTILVPCKNLIEAQALCFRLTNFKGNRDSEYTKPVENSVGNKWFVQLFNKHKGALSQAERSSIVNELPEGFYEVI